MAEIVIPGKDLGEGKAGKNTYELKGRVKAKVFGLKRLAKTGISVIPLAGKYNPKKNDKVIGRIMDIQISGWLVDLHAPYIGYLPLSEVTDRFIDVTKEDLSKLLDFNQLIFAKILNVPKFKVIQLTMKEPVCKKLKGGILVEINPAKVPRLIGKGGSMIELIKKKTECKIVVGQNGLVWIEGKWIEKAVKAIKLVEKEAHTTGLTERVSKYLDEL